MHAVDMSSVPTSNVAVLSTNNVLKFNDAQFVAFMEKHHNPDGVFEPPISNMIHLTPARKSHVVYMSSRKTRGKQCISLA